LQLGKSANWCHLQLDIGQNGGICKQTKQTIKSCIFNEKKGELWRFVKTIGCLKKRENRVDAKPEM